MYIRSYNIFTGYIDTCTINSMYEFGVTFPLQETCVYTSRICPLFFVPSRQLVDFIGVESAPNQSQSLWV